MSGDALSDLLRSVRLRGAVFYYVSFRDRWAAEAPAADEIAEAVMPGCEHVMGFHMIAKGGGWIALDGLPAVKVATGDILIFPHGDHHVLSREPGMPPPRFEADWIFARRDDPKPLPISYHHGVMEVGAQLPVEEADTVAICGFLGCDTRPFNPLLAALPRLLHLPASADGAWITRLVEQAALESNNNRPGGNAVLEHLSEMMFIDASRRYLDSLPEDAAGWLAGLRDRFVGRALSLLHARPDHPWSIDELARQTGLSRSALHDRFMQCIGHPPMHYLANWRIQLGARLLRESRCTVATIALEVGYDSEAAFCRAFKRLVGLPPATWRKAQTIGNAPASNFGSTAHQGLSAE